MIVLQSCLYSEHSQLQSSGGEAVSFFMGLLPKVQDIPVLGLEVRSLEYVVV